MNRSGWLRRAQGALRRSPISKVGRRVKREQEALQAFREAVRARDVVCQRCGTDREPLDPHHMRKRWKGGKAKHDPSVGVLLCRWCHNAVHDHTAPDWKDWTLD